MVSPESPTSHRVVFGPILALEDPLFASIAAIQRSDPLRGVTVVVASNLLGVHLRRRYVEWRENRGLSAAHAGIAFSTLASLAADVAGPGPPPLPPFGAFALLSDALARLPEAKVFGDLAARPELVPSLEATIRDLADAGVSGKAFRSFVESAPLAPERRLLLGAVARFFEAIERGAEGHEPPWRLYRRAGTPSRSGSPEPILLYGFYDATGVQQEFLVSLARRRPVFAFVPRPSGRYGEFADRFLAWLTTTLGASEEAAHESPTSPLAPLRRRLGEATGSVDETGDAVHLVSAASAAGERTEIAREIVMAAEAGVPLHRIAVIARESGVRTNALSRELLRLGIPSFEYGPPTFASSPAGRALNLWWNLEEEDFRREDVLAVLDLLAAERGVPEATTSRSIARQAGIVGGARSWAERLDALERSARSPAEAAAARALAAECGSLVASSSDWARAPKSWSAWSTDIRRRLETLYAPGKPPAGVVSAAEALAALDELGGPVERPAAGHVFFAALAEQGENAGRLGVDGVFIGSAMASRGLTFALTIVAGLVEREFPEPGRPDPLFFDAERAALARATNRPVPLKTQRRLAEERQLFGMAVGSAITRLVCTTARRDETLTRDMLPSPFFTDTDGASSKGGVSRVRRTHLGAAVAAGPSLSAAEALDRALQRSGPATVALAYPPLERARERIALAASPRWSAFDGKLGSASRIALESHRLKGDRSISASAIEMFATCSYRYFFRRVLRLNEWDEAERVSELDPLWLGKAFHDAARRIVASGLEWPPDPSASLAGRVSEESIQAVEQQVGPIGPALLRELAVRRLEALVREWLRFEAARSDDSRPYRAELEFGASGSLIFDTGAFPVRLHGFIDRIDVDAGGNPARVVDYKVKFAPKFRDEFGAQGRILGGEASQLAVYAVAAGAPVEAEYLYLMAGDGAAPQIAAVSRTPEQTGEAIAALRTLLIGVDRAIASGTFLPRTAGRLRKDLCEYCAYLSVCGPGHVSRFDAKEDDPDPEARALRLIQELP